MRCATWNLDPAQRDDWLCFRSGLQKSPDFIDKGASKSFDFGDVLITVSGTGLLENGRSCVHRGRFLEEILDLIPPGIAEFNKAVEQIEDVSGASGVKLFFKDGTTAKASIVLACDGVKSVARRLVLESSPELIEPVFAGDYAYRRLVPMERSESRIWRTSCK